MGSSPRVWGQARRRHLPIYSPRIIPTRVGTRPKPAVTDTLNGDHPHACGDKGCYPDLNNECVGSSPRVWGQGTLDALKLSHTRIIPTRVGTSCWHSVRVYAHRDHPHACGDKTSKPYGICWIAGSSPRVWGQV